MGVASQVAEQLRTENLRKLGNTREILKLVGGPVSLPEIKLWP